MKKLATAILICSLFALTGCDEKAQEYAKKLGQVLNSYQAQVNRKINAEQEAYKSLTTFYAHAQDEDLFLNLALERNKRAREMAEGYISGQNAPTTSEIRASLKNYASYDFEQTRVLLENEAEASTRFLANLESLELEGQKVESLSKALEELSKPKKPLKQLKEFVSFATQVDKEMQKLACDDLAKQIKCLEKEIAKEQDAKKKETMTAELTKLKSKLQDEKTAGKCSANVDTLECPKE